MTPTNPPTGLTLPRRVAVASDRWKEIARLLLNTPGGWLRYPDLLDWMGISSHQFGGIYGGQKFTLEESPIRQSLEDGEWYVYIEEEDWGWLREAIA